MEFLKIALTLVLSAMLFSSASGKILGPGSSIDNSYLEAIIEAANNVVSNGDNALINGDNHSKDVKNLEVQNFDDVVKDMDKALSEKDDPCTIFEPSTPNFRTEGRRISETKCLEFVWDAKVQDETDRRRKECMARFTDFTMVIGGRFAEPGEFPHMGALGWKATKGDWVFMCGSFLISDKFVLTAAHCQQADDDVTGLAHSKPKIVRFGVENIIKDDQRTPLDIKILKFIKHPDYRPYPYKSFDIAVVELSKRVTFDKFVRPACIISQKVKEASVTGWGVVDKELFSKDTSDKLKVAEVDVLPPSVCKKKLKNKLHKTYWKKLQRHQMCAAKVQGTADTCRGDSGGPLQAKLNVSTKQTIYNVVGITSFGFYCGVNTFPSVYTKVSSFIEWIESVVWSTDTRELRSLYNEDSGESKKEVYNVQHYKNGDLYSFSKGGGQWSYVIH